MNISNNLKEDKNKKRKMFLVFSFIELLCLFFAIHFYHDGDFGKMYMDMMCQLHNVDNISALFPVPDNLPDNLQALKKMKCEEDGERVANKIQNLEKNQEYGSLMNDIYYAKTNEKMNAVLEKVEKLTDNNKFEVGNTKQEAVKTEETIKNLKK